jgi:NAD(P)-dependent dehydrogenase (short-subunit alcohol dehydrogenase family)
MPAFLTLVVGANRGIGLELCRQLHARGDQVIGVCRRASEDLKGLGIFKVIEGVDISSPESVAALPGQLGAGAKIDNLWLNAGIGIGIEDSLEVGGFEVLVWLVGWLCAWCVCVWRGSERDHSIA